MKKIFITGFIIILFSNIALSDEKKTSIGVGIDLFDKIVDYFKKDSSVNQVDENMEACKKFEGDWELYNSYQYWPAKPGENVDLEDATATATKVSWKPFCVKKQGVVFLSGIDITEHTIKVGNITVASSTNATSIDINFENGIPKSRTIGSMLSFTVEPIKEIIEYALANANCNDNNQNITIEDKELNRQAILSEIKAYKKYMNNKKKIGTVQDRQCSISTDFIDGKYALKAKCTGYEKVLIKQ